MLTSTHGVAYLCFIFKTFVSLFEESVRPLTVFRFNSYFGLTSGILSKHGITSPIIMTLFKEIDKKEKENVTFLKILTQNKHMLIEVRIWEYSVCFIYNYAFTLYAKYLG